ncbi:DNA dC-_dU-editing enzyme APOBEC-3C-like [Dromiciops gliroides]|uniref:DNA dC->dU-editing enzyme APOBEC-3C-like n=1 Tax=Dromiciops gliroides TaxID=33562 RepID=UPI001CC73F8E|nr:DNA dC->dU-editing enzyme APOBEC-3C-like [Dromiciops gliroides]XP_043852261.1 DNA dC->dU-editing enzyme APOBEC-3C-like [Dromiciops gliroides]
MPLMLRKEISEEEFYEQFCNTTAPHQTLLCFSLKEDDKTLWRLWGHAYNNPSQCHAEVLVLRETEDYLGANIPNATKFSIIWFLSYSPCHLCCDEITNFLTKCQTKIEFIIKVARPYYFSNDQNQKGLRMLKRQGVLIKMMEYSDYEECLYLFVDPCSNFTAWPDLEVQSTAHKIIFHHLLAQEDNTLDAHSFPTNDSSSVHTGSASDFESHILVNKILPEDPNKTPDKKDEFSDIRTPQKTCITQRTIEDGKEVKRKLF